MDFENLKNGVAPYWNHDLPDNRQLTILWLVCTYTIIMARILPTESKPCTLQNLWTLVFNLTLRFLHILNEVSVSLSHIPLTSTSMLNVGLIGIVGCSYLTTEYYQDLNSVNMFQLLADEEHFRYKQNQTYNYFRFKRNSIQGPIQCW